MPIPEGGPHLVSALICDRVLTEKDNVHSLIRIIDRTTIGTEGPQSQAPMPPFTKRLWMFLAFKADRARGSEMVKVTITRPDGQTDPEPLAEQGLHFEGGTKGANLIVGLEIRFELPGPYWFNIYVEDKLVTRTPYEVIHTHRRVRQSPSTQ